MKADQIRCVISPITLSWTIYEEKVSVEELQNFTKEELRKILRVASIQEHIDTIKQLLK